MEQISARQLGALVFVTRMGMAIVRLPAIKHVKQGPDAWLGVLVGTLAGVLALWALLSLIVRRPGRDLLDLSVEALGPYFGRAAGAMYVLWFAWDAMVSMRLYSGLLFAQPLPETPAEAMIFMLGAGAAYAALQGPEVVGRLGGMLAPVIFVGAVLVLTLGINQMDPKNLKPFLGYGGLPVFRSALFPAFAFSETLACSLLLPYSKEPRKAVRGALAGAVAGGLVTALGAAAVVMFYGSTQATRLAYPLYDLARSVSFGEFFERMDPLFIVMWTVASYIKVAMLIWAVARGLSKLLGLKRVSELVFPLTLLFSFGAMRTYGNQAEISTLTSVQVYPLLTFPFLIGIPALLLAAVTIRGSRGRSS